MKSSHCIVALAGALVIACACRTGLEVQGPRRCSWIGTTPDGQLGTAIIVTPKATAAAPMIYASEPGWKGPGGIRGRVVRLTGSPGSVAETIAENPAHCSCTFGTSLIDLFPQDHAAEAGRIGIVAGANDVCGGHVYVIDESGRVLAAVNGRQLGTVFDGPAVFAPTTDGSRPGLLVCAVRPAGRGGLVALDAWALNLVWSAFEEPSASDSGFGATLATVPDVDADGVDDVIVGASLATFGPVDRGGAVSLLSSENGATLWTIKGARDYGEFGSCIGVTSPDAVTGAVSLLVGSTAAFAGEPGSLFVIDARDGRIQRTIAPPAGWKDIGSSVASVVADGSHEKQFFLVAGLQQHACEEWGDGMLLLEGGRDGQWNWADFEDPFQRWSMSDRIISRMSASSTTTACILVGSPFTPLNEPRHAGSITEFKLSLP